jgi:GNAT superfamily N-acetyltransferase
MRTMELRIQRATAAHAEPLTEIARAAKAHWGYPAPWLAQWAPDLTITADLVGRQPTFVAIRGETAIGFYMIEDRNERWSLAHLWVVPAWHGMGVGRRLVAHALATVARLRPGVLEVESDPNAVAFYERCGARRIGSVPAPMPGAPSRALPLLAFSAPDGADHMARSGAPR